MAVLDRSKEIEVRGFERFDLRMPEPRRLSNGIPLVVVKRGFQPVCRLDVIMLGGRYEQPFVRLAHSMANMLSAGTATKTKDEIAEVLDYNGATMASEAGQHHTITQLISLTSRLPEVLPLCFECITQPSFPERELEQMRRKLRTEVRVLRERVEVCAMDALLANAYGRQHPSAQVLTQDVVSKMRHDVFADFHKRYFTPANCQLILSGNVGDDEIELIDKYFGAWQSDTPAGEKIKAEIRPMRSHISLCHKREVVQDAVAVNIEAVPRSHPDYVALRVLACALGGYFGSRLNRNIREDKGYTYGISASLYGSMDRGDIRIETECASEYSELVIAEILKELAELKRNPLGEEELRAVKWHMLSQLAEIFDSPFSVANHFSMVVTGLIDIDYFNDQVEQLHTITAERLHEVAQKCLCTERLRIAIAGSSATKEVTSRMLKG